MEQPKSNKNPQSATDAMNRLHNLASEHPDPEKDKIAKKLLEQWEKAQEEGNSDEVIRLIGEIDKLYDETPEKEGEKEKTPDEHVEVPKTEKLSPNTSRELKENGTITVGPLKGAFDSEGFFRGWNKNVKIYIGDGFKDGVLKSAGSVSEQPPATIASFTLAKKMHDTEIRAELPKNHVFSPNDLWMIADLIKKQANGESGHLLADGKANIFYVQVSALVFVVRVYRDGSAWGVCAWDLDEIGWWDGGQRVFSRNG
jgi:hypothetical protein